MAKSYKQVSCLDPIYESYENSPRRILTVTALVLARPYLFDSQGVGHSEIIPMRETALFDKKGSFRQEYLRVRSTAGGVEMFEKQSSGVLYSTSWGDGLVVQKPDEDIHRGDRVDVIPFLLFN